MPSRLTWRNATKADKGELDVFCCTTPAEKPSVANGWQPRHPRKWEYEAQQYLRGRQIPGPQSPFFMRVGRTTDEELVGVAYYEEVDGPGFVYFHAASEGSSEGVRRSDGRDLLHWGGRVGPHDSRRRRRLIARMRYV